MMKTRLARLLRPRSGRDGFIIVAVLWILAALATLVTIFSIYVINTASAFAVHDERLQAEGLARAAIELSAYQASAAPQGQAASQGQAVAPGQTITRGTFLFRLGNALVNAEFVSETARIDLNAAPKELLSGLFAGLGASRAQADFYADRIIGWRSPAPEDNSAGEAANYRTAGMMYGPRGAPFPHTGELGLVLGIPELMVERALPYLTVYSGQAQVNIFNAAPQVLAALPGMDPQRLQTILVRRAAAPQNEQTAQALLATLGAGQTHANAQGSKTLRVTARIAFDSGQRMTTEAVIFLLDGGADPYRVLTWQDDMDNRGVR
jgi:general secretion pathway protein K